MNKSTAKIIDEFTDMEISRQRKKQLRNLRDGKCMRCDEPLVTKNYCLGHAVRVRELQRKREGRVKRLNSLTYRLENDKRGAK